ncbi:hypothetical protein Z043_106586 [Scleropages formosus]|uniref:Catenin alpha-2-like n=1 Tax=Scleropages formosus TaxID=113540 RepID=A0A0N8K189_SCLFO|nr:hypothetical protein Z043_106586 [Scleropages formosus]
MSPRTIFTKTGRKEKGDLLNSAIEKMTKKTRDLRRQLRKAVMDHISDSFLETNVPLLVLIEAAKSGNEKEVKEYAQVFREHANKLVEGNKQGFETRGPPFICAVLHQACYRPQVMEAGMAEAESEQWKPGEKLISILLLINTPVERERRLQCPRPSLAAGKLPISMEESLQPLCDDYESGMIT